MTTSHTKLCKECGGDGYIEYDVPKPHGFDRDVGYIDSATEVCPECQGLGIAYEEEDISFQLPNTRLSHNYNAMIDMLVAARHEQRLSQPQLANIIGCTESLIHKWEQHKRVPSGFFLMCWLEALGYDIEVTKKEDNNNVRQLRK